MLNVGDLLSDPDFAQAFTIQRSTGVFALGGWQNTTTGVPAVGVIRPASEREIQLVPEGDRVTGLIAIHSAAPLYLTRTGPAPGLSDVIVWRGDSYRLLKLWPYADFGYYKALGARLTGS